MIFGGHVTTFFSGSLILIVAAVVPAFLLLRFIYRSDRLEAESGKLIGRLVLMGVISTFIAIMCEKLGGAILGLIFRRPNTLYYILMYFIVVGFSEEVSKWTVLNKTTWNNPEFNCKFDGVVYSVTVALGFALWENLGYVMMYGLSTALLRAVTAVPGHACFGVFMGVWYGMAKRCELRGDVKACRSCKILCVAMPAFIHGCYDYIATLESAGSTLIFVVFVGAMFIVSYIMVRKLSANDDYL